MLGKLPKLAGVYLGGVFFSVDQGFLIDVVRGFIYISYLRGNKLCYLVKMNGI